MLSGEELERRKPLWWALSDLWLVSFVLDQTADDEKIREALASRHNAAEIESALPGSEDNYIVREMISSGYSLSEIEKILSEEVAPVIYYNLYKPYGGEWGTFNPEWLYGAILENIAKQNNNFIYRNWVKSSLGRFVMMKMVEDDWEKIVKLYHSLKD